MTNSDAESLDQNSKQEWYKDGLRFSCSQCGNCCTGGPGAVWYTADEGRAMAVALGLTDEEFTAKYTRAIADRRSLNESETPHGFDCVFLDRTSQPGRALCGVYTARPAQCRTWPFWPENLTTPKAWKAAKSKTPCHGMDNGTLYPIEQIRILRERDHADNHSAPW